MKKLLGLFLTITVSFECMAHAETIEIYCGEAKQTMSDGKVYSGNLDLSYRFDLIEDTVGLPLGEETLDKRDLDFVNEVFITWNNTRIYKNSGSFKYVSNVFNRRTGYLTSTNIIMNNDYSDTRSFITSGFCE